MAELYLVRHGIAEDQGPEWPDDALRPLTHKGRARMRKIARRLEKLGVELDVIVTSPLVRTRQTADILHGGVGGSRPVEELAVLTPGASAAEVVAALEKYESARAIAVVGHEPDMGRLAAYLIGARATLPFRKGGVCRIDMESMSPTPPGTLIWFAPPKLLR